MCYSHHITSQQPLTQLKMNKVQKVLSDTFVLITHTYTYSYGEGSSEANSARYTEVLLTSTKYLIARYNLG